jgi:hypothetical protein
MLARQAATVVLILGDLEQRMLGRIAMLEASSVLQQEESKDAPVENVSNVSQEKWGEILEKMTPDDFKYKQ